MENLSIMTIGGVNGYEKDGVAYINLEDVARGLGFTDKTRNVEYVKWDRVKRYLADIGFSTEVSKDTFIPENIVYRLAMKAKNDVAERFQAKIADEVAPSIRKHGMYATEETLDKMISSPEFGIKLLTALKEEKEKTKSLTAKVEQDAPKVLFADAVATAKTSILVGELAKILRQNGVEIGQNRLFKWLRKNGYLISRIGTDYNMPTQYSMERGWMEIKEHAITRPDGATIVTKTTVITGKGQQYFINLFLKGGNANG